MIRKVVSPMLAAAALALCISGSASAQGFVPDQRTFFTFSAPVALPGVTLPAGKYIFRLADSPSNRHIVQVFNADGTKIFATLLAMAAERREIPNDPEIQFRETPANSPAAIDIWYYPGTKTGHQFIFSKDESAKWATAKSDFAKVAKGEIAPASVVFSNADVAAAAQTATPTPATPATPIASAVRPDTTMADSSASMNTRANRTALPHTASSLPLVGAIGLLSLFAGVAVLSLRRRAQA